MLDMDMVPKDAKDSSRAIFSGEVYLKSHSEISSRCLFNIKIDFYIRWVEHRNIFEKLYKSLCTSVFISADRNNLNRTKACLYSTFCRNYQNV